MELVKDIINEKASTVRTEYLKEITNLALQNMDNEGFIIDEKLGREYEHKLEELLKQIRTVKINNDERKFFIKEVGKYDEVTLETEIKVFSFNLKDNKEDTITETITYDYLIDFTNAITEVEWVEFTTVCTDKSLLRNVNGIKAVLELMLV